MLDYIRIACAVPEVQVANVEKNTRDICDFMEKADTQNVDVLVDGPFIMAKRTLDARFRGSSNQRLIDVAASLRTGNAVECHI